MSAALPHQIDERYEQLRLRALTGKPGHLDALTVLRRRGLHAWVADVASSPSPLRQEKRTASVIGESEARWALATRLSWMESEHAPLVSVCVDMLLNTLTKQEAA